MAGFGFSDDELAGIEREHPEGLSSEAIVGLLRARGIRLTEATLRKYVQLGLLPRSRRVALARGVRGSQGLYPASVVRRIQRLRTMMQEHTIDEIKQDLPFAPGDIEELQYTLERIFGQMALSRAAAEELGEARRLATELVAKIERIEARLTHEPI